jgi:lipid-binding SYLF domain-containing protein
MEHTRIMRKTQFVLLTVAAVLPAAASDEAAGRLGRAATVLATITESARGIRAEQRADADCIAVIPGFKKGAAVVGVGYGRGFISCRNGSTWSAPAAITLETGSLGVQIGGEEIDIVILSLDKERRSKLLSERFTIGSDASAAWGNGKSAHEDPNAKILFFGHTKGAFAGFGLDGATLKPDDSGNKALYGKTLSNTQIVEEAKTPAVAQSFIQKLTQESNR